MHITNDVWWNILTMLPISDWYCLICTCVYFYDVVTTSNLYKELSKIGHSRNISNFFASALRDGNMSICNYILKIHRGKIEYKVIQSLFDQAIITQNLNMVIYLNNTFTLDTLKAYRECMYTKNDICYTVFEYLLKNILTFDKSYIRIDSDFDIFYITCRNSNVKIASLIYEHIRTHPEKIHQEPRCQEEVFNYCQLLIACSKRNLVIFQTIYKDYCDKYTLTPNLLRKLLNITIFTEYTSQLEWILAVTGNDIYCQGELIFRTACGHEKNEVIQWICKTVPKFKVTRSGYSGELIWKIKK